jgi:hypothetical protein
MYIGVPLDVSASTKRSLGYVWTVQIRDSHRQLIHESPSSCHSAELEGQEISGD